MSRLLTNTRFLALLIVVAIVGVTGYVLWATVWGKSSQPGESNVAYYQDSMHPWIKSDRPGKCTICGMDLTPIYQGSKGFGAAGNVVVLSPNSISVISVKTEEVKRRPLCRTLRVAGTLEANESRKVVISAPAASRIDALAVPYAGMEVQKGQSLITLFSPDLVQKGRVLRAAALNQGGSAGDTSPAVVGSNPFSAELYAPQSGTVVERPVSVGQFVTEGEKLLAIADASVLWFRFDVYEQQLPWCELGQQIDVVVPAVPGPVFPAVIEFIEPTINEATRTVKVRADIQNPSVVIKGRTQRLLRFGMYAEGRLGGDIPEVTAVPRTAILFPGGSAYAYVDKGNGAFEMRRVKLGRQCDEFWEVLHGLEEGERVVTSGNVLIDAQAQFNQGSIPEAETAGAAEAVATTAVATPQASPATEPASMAAAPAAPMSEPASMAAAPAMPMPDPPDGSVAPQRPVTRRDKVTAFAAEQDNMRAMRQAAMAKAKGQTMADATLLTPGAQPVAATQQLLPYAEQDAARRTISEEMRKVRQAAIAGHEQAMAETAALGVQPPAPAATSNAGDPSAMPASPGAMPPDTATPAPAAGAPCAPRQALSYVEQDAARRAISVDMRKERQALIAAGQGQAMAEATPSAGAPSAMPAPAAGESAANGQAEPRPVMSYRDQDAARRALSEEMRKVRQVAMANAQVQQAAETPALTATQRQTLKDFVTVADGISRALAADDCKQFNEHMARLPVVLPALQKELAVSPHWAAPVQRLAAFGGEAKPAKDLDEARRQFLPLSTATVDLVKQLRKEDSAFSDLKIYHCPMAPKPGLWMQAQGPLRNPFYGSQMLTCGDEVKP